MITPGTSSFTIIAVLNVVRFLKVAKSTRIVLESIKNFYSARIATRILH